MRFGWVAAAAAMMAAVPAGAATIVQYDSEQGANFGFQGFDSRNGRLDKVTLDITLSKSRGWQIDAPLAAGSVRTVDWAVDGVWSLDGSYLGQATPLLVPLIGAGTSNVTLGNSFEGRSYGYFQVDAKGSASLDLDPARFIDRRSFFNGFDTGYLDPDGADTTFQVAGSNRLIHLSGSCFVVNGAGPHRTPEDFCGTASYRLTFDYTPGAVPEAATWVMMLIGFGLIGGALRRGRRRTATELQSSLAHQ